MSRLYLSLVSFHSVTLIGVRLCASSVCVWLCTRFIFSINYTTVQPLWMVCSTWSVCRWWRLVHQFLVVCFEKIQTFLPFSLFISSFFLSSSPFSFLGPKYSSSRTHSTRLSLSLSQHLFISYDELPESVGGRAIENENLEKFSARQKFFGLFRCLPLVDASLLFPSRTKTVLFSIESVGSGTISFSFLSFSKKPRTLYQDRHQRQTKTLINTFLPSDFWLVQSIEKPIESSVWHFYLPFGVMSTTRKDMRTG